MYVCVCVYTEMEPSERDDARIDESRACAGKKNYAVSFRLRGSSIPRPFFFFFCLSVTQKTPLALCARRPFFSSPPRLNRVHQNYNVGNFSALCIYVDVCVYMYYNMWECRSERWWWGTGVNWSRFSVRLSRAELRYLKLTPKLWLENIKNCAAREKLFAVEAKKLCVSWGILRRWERCVA